MLSKSLIQLSADGQGCVSSLLFDLRPNYGGGNDGNGHLLQKAPQRHCCTQCPTLQQPPSHTPLPQTPGHSRASLGQCLVGSLLLSLGYWCTRFCLCPPRVYFPVLCNFWLLCGGVNGALLQEGLFHAQVCCACLCSSPLLTHTSTGDAQRQFCLSLCEVSGSWCA